ncbi:MAG TPA: YCF48-related protein, partial [Candidatus Eremiobacteraceae bacterium]|nr:YCF48-related protein [Candidatus Eremiobacteraceae bacterium]
QPLAFQVNDLLFTKEAWFAASTGGVLISLDKGATWRVAGSDPFAKQPAQSLEASLDGSQIWAISQKNLLYSADSGKHWEAKELNFSSAGNLHLHRVDDSNLYVTTNMGLYVSKDAGRNWNRADARDLQFQDVAGAGTSLVASLQKRGLLTSSDAGKSWQRLNDPVAEGFFPVVQARRSGAVVAASATEGILTFESSARSADSVGSSALAPSGSTQKPR